MYIFGGSGSHFGLLTAGEGNVSSFFPGVSLLEDSHGKGKINELSTKGLLIFVIQFHNLWFPRSIDFLTRMIMMFGNLCTNNDFDFDVWYKGFLTFDFPCIRRYRCLVFGNQTSSRCLLSTSDFRPKERPLRSPRTNRVHQSCAKNVGLFDYSIKAYITLYSF